MSKFIWSNTGTVDYLLGLEPDELRNTLANDFSYDSSMLEETPDNELENIIYDDVEIFDNLDIEDWEQSIAPELGKQTKYDIVLKVSKNGDGEMLSLKDMMDIGYDDKLVIEADDENNVYSVSYSHDRPTGESFNWYVYPKDETGFVVGCLDDLVQEKLELYGGDDKIYEYTEEDAVDDAVSDLIDDPEYVINNYCDFSRVPLSCERFKAPSLIVGESLTEARRKQTAGTKNVSQLEMELADLEARYNDNGGADGFYTMTFNEFSDAYPEFTNSILISFLESMVDYHIDEESEEDTEDYWASGDLITNRDWPALFEGAHKIIDDGWNDFGWIAVWKDYYSKDSNGDDFNITNPV